MGVQHDKEMYGHVLQRGVRRLHGKSNLLFAGPQICVRVLNDLYGRNRTFSLTFPNPSNPALRKF